MPKVKGKVQLCITEEYKKFFKAIQGFGGHTLFDKYNAIENVVAKNIDEKYHHFLAQPVVENDLITWFTKPYNETPQQFSALRDSEGVKYERIKNETIAHYSNVINSLKQEGKIHEAEHLEKATKYVDDRFIYCYDEKVVLGIWGMQLRDHVKAPLGIAMINVFIVKAKPIVPIQPEPEPTIEPEPETPISQFKVSFNSGDEGKVVGVSDFLKFDNETIFDTEIPKIETIEGYEFIGWDQDPNDYFVTSNIVFTAQYRQIPPVFIPPIILPWYKRFWSWLRTLFFGSGCLKWLLRLLLLLLLIFLLLWLFRDCRGNNSNPIPYPIADKPWIGDDPYVGGGGIYNPGAPYKPTPTPPGYGDFLPPNQGVLPPIDNPEIIRVPGMPAVIGNRLNILLENNDKSIMDFAKDFKMKYPEDKYKILYYDDLVKRMQIEIPSAERSKLKQEIPDKFAPEYELFIFDESLFEGAYNPNDPAFNDPDKSWYLKAIKAPEAWDITRGAKKLTVAIVDNGFNLNHPELKSKVVMPYNVWLHSNKIFPQQVDHGTHVAGTALAIIDNGEGLCGIAPECLFMPVQVADKNDLMTTTSVLDGILYALYQGADVINISLGGVFTGLDQYSEEYQRELFRNHFKEEERLWNKIMEIADKHQSIIVVAAGNDNILTGIDPLQRPKNIITVSAVDKVNKLYSKADFSNYGEYSTISAPGVDIYSTIGSNNYATMEGTSMAAPIVTGAVALMKSLNENLTAEQIICILQGTGVPVKGKVGNLIQLDKALQKVNSGEVDDCKGQPEIASSGDVQILLSWNNYNDLDIACIDPDGNMVYYKNKKVPSGGMLEIDMNVDPNGSKTPIENIYWPSGGAPDGTYNVYLMYYKRHDTNISDTPYTISVKYGDKIEEVIGIIKEKDNNKHIYSFTLGSNNSTLNTNNSNSSNLNYRRNKLLKEKDLLKLELHKIDRELKEIINN